MLGKKRFLRLVGKFIRRSRHDAHDLAKGADVILGFVRTVSGFETKILKIGSKVCQGFLLQESCQIDRSVGQKFAAPQTDKQCMIFVTRVGSR